MRIEPGSRSEAGRPSALRGRYLVTSPVANLALRLLDGAVELAIPRRPRPEPAAPRRLLIAFGGHLGDAVIATRAIAIARSRFPRAEIGVLAPSWVAPIVEGHSLVRWVHAVDHWKSSRAPISHLAKLKRYWATARTAAREIRAVGYDTAIDLYPHFPNASRVLWAAAVPVRLGFASGGLGRLYTTSVEWTESERHFSDAAFDLFELLPGSRTGAEPELPQLAAPAPSDARAVERLLAEAGIPEDDFVVLHMGAGSPMKQWPAEKWVDLTRALVAAGANPVFTGAGAGETAEARSVIEAVGAGVSFCDRLRWPEFVSLVSRARLLVCTDSVAGHVASATGVPSVAVMPGVNPTYQWRPLGERSLVVTNPVECAPCYRSRGCESMACVRGVEVREVLRQVDLALALRAPVAHAPSSATRVAR